MQKLVLDVSIYMQQMTSADNIFRFYFFNSKRRIDLTNGNLSAFALCVWRGGMLVGGGGGGIHFF